jgi:hypothetical protein
VAVNGYASTIAVNLNVKVIDPHGTAVADARVVLYPDNSTEPRAVRRTSAAGFAEFPPMTTGGDFILRVLAPGFSPAEVKFTHSDSRGTITVQLKLATRAETVEVSATRTPLTGEDSAVDVSSLTATQLTTLLPSAASDAIRFLPGAVVNEAGRRGGLASLFVRGGESRYNKVLIDDVPVNDPGGTFNFGVVPMEQVMAAIGPVLPNEKALAGLDGLTAVFDGTPFIVRQARTDSFRAAVLAADYVRSRTAGSTSRYLRSVLEPSRWDELQREAVNRIESRLGARFELVTEVNFVVATAKAG